MLNHINNPSFIFGFGMAFLGLRSIFKVWKIKYGGIETVGKIIDISDVHEESGTLPVIEYLTLTGEVVQKKSSVYYHKVHLNQDIPLIYNAQNPHQMIQDSFRHKYLLGIVLLIMGIFFMVVHTSPSYNGNA